MLVRWNPFRELSSLQGEMNRLFEGFGRRPPTAETPTLWSPAVDVYEDEHNIVFKAELPGMNKDDIEVLFENGLLTLKGERKLEKEVKEENYHQVERSYGRFVRSFTVPAAVEAEKIAANFKEGLLEVVLPKAEEAKPKTIAVSGA
jgi:HSP20 family protein